MQFTLTVSDVIEAIGILVSLITSVVAIFISLKTLKQNSDMIEESTRPVISVYAQSINPGVPMFYLVVKNFGASTAYMESFDSDFDFSNCYKGKDSRNYIEDLNKCVIAPNQSRTCFLDYQKVPDNVHFSIKYSSVSKTYSEEFNVNLKAAASMPCMKFATKDKELLSISYSLQEMLLKGL